MVGVYTMKSGIYGVDFCVILMGSFERDWLRKDLNVIGFGLIGWEELDRTLL